MKSLTAPARTRKPAAGQSQARARRFGRPMDADDIPGAVVPGRGISKFSARSSRASVVASVKTICALGAVQCRQRGRFQTTRPGISVSSSIASAGNSGWKELHCHSGVPRFFKRHTVYYDLNSLVLSPSYKCLLSTSKIAILHGSGGAHSGESESVGRRGCKALGT